MCPQFVDFDADGYTDIVTATYEGVVFLVPGGKAGWLEPEHVVDRNGDNVQLSMYYDFEGSGSWEHTDRGMPEGRKDHCVSVAPFDWDADGDFDLLLGAYDGALFLQRNEGSNAEPAFTGTNELVMAEGRPLEVKGGLTAPRLVDWDGDGDQDIVTGGFKGGVHLITNAGKVGEPAFRQPVALVAKAEPGSPDVPVEGLYADPVDYDGDGDLDLVVGGYAKWSPEARELTEDEEVRLAEMDARLEAIQAELAKHFDEAQQRVEALGDDPPQEKVQEVYDAVFSGEDFQKLSTEQRELMQAVDELRPRPKREPAVWLYTRTG